MNKEGLFGAEEQKQAEQITWCSSSNLYKTCQSYRVSGWDWFNCT